MYNLKALVISLESAHKRRKTVRDLLEDTRLDWSFLNAVDGKLLKTTPEYNAAKVKRLLGFNLTPNEIGCFLSHKNAWAKCAELNETILILEDDFLLREDYDKAIYIALNKLQNWEILRLQSLFDSPHKLVNQIDGFQLTENLTDPIGATAYLIKPQAATVLLKHSREIFEPVDHFLEHSKYHGLRFKALKPYPISITGVCTTIEDRPERAPTTKLNKIKRSINRVIDRLINSKPWFPK